MHKDLREIEQSSKILDKVAKAKTLKEQMKKIPANKTDGPAKKQAKTTTQSSTIQSFNFQKANFSGFQPTYNIGAALAGPSTCITERQNEDSEKQTENEETNNKERPVADLNNILQGRPVIPNLTPEKFREEVFQMVMNSLIHGNLIMSDVVRLQRFVNFFRPTTLSQQLDFMAARLLSEDLQNDVILAALKVSASKILSCINPKVNQVFQKHIKDTQVWHSAAQSTVQLPDGLSDASKTVFEEVIKSARDDKQKLNKRLLNIAVCRKKLEIVESDEPDREILEVLDVIVAIANNFSEKQREKLHSTSPSEMTFYRKFAQVLDIVLRDSRLDINDGEHVCKASKAIADRNKRFDSTKKNSTTFGRRIDLMLTSKGIEFSTNEWKRNKVSLSTSLKQQSKNIRLNKGILTSFFENPIPRHLHDQVFCIGMDWTGCVGYMFYVKKYQDAYIAKTVTTLEFPTEFEDIAEFLHTLNYIYIWRNHHENLIDIVIPAANSRQKNKILANLVYEGPDDVNDGEFDVANTDELDTTYIDVPETTEWYSPNVLFTPSRKRRASAVIESEASDDESNSTAFSLL
ncbi:hypothetical protein DFQ28_008443 [Apophysomyces sp. BC1034]|nr:hypothetical protein DFQ28_008443 [Apophysomyces sp. BC1034]